LNSNTYGTSGSGLKSSSSDYLHRREDGSTWSDGDHKRSSSTWRDDNERRGSSYHRDGGDDHSGYRYKDSEGIRRWRRNEHDKQVYSDKDYDYFEDSADKQYQDDEGYKHDHEERGTSRDRLLKREKRIKDELDR